MDSCIDICKVKYKNRFLTSDLLHKNLAQKAMRQIKINTKYIAQQK